MTKAKMANKAIKQQADRVIAALRAALAAPAPATKEKRAAAEEIIRLRKLFRYEGMPDWGGRNVDYQLEIEHCYREANVPPDGDSSFLGNVRYHVGNALRRIAPAEDLEALGLQIKSPKDRAIEAHKQQRRERRRPVVGPAVSVGNPDLLVGLALNAIQSLRTMDPDPTVEPALRELLDEVRGALADLI